MADVTNTDNVIVRDAPSAREWPLATDAAYNCPLSAGGTVSQCWKVRRDFGCPLYDAVNNDCSWAERSLWGVKFRGRETPTEG